MAWKQLVRASAWALVVLLASFFVVNVIMTAWYSYTDPYDGQGGLAAFVLGLYVAPAFAIVTFALVLIRGR